ncbi:hypothetical protein Y032_0620g742 [Ancylostoma ceylanicum]|uniref:Uncharacterized protein n=1 Tax=Ancylostoma ceylanicum TaxID=53326 RepID=A0A016WL22_9BILA|nr:hypothetical protein Y032_0620g742 [Ancylostoma ceylanicum]
MTLTEAMAQVTALTHQIQAAIETLVTEDTEHDFDFDVRPAARTVVCEGPTRVLLVVADITPKMKLVRLQLGEEALRMDVPVWNLGQLVSVDVLKTVEQALGLDEERLIGIDQCRDWLTTSWGWLQEGISTCDASARAASITRDRRPAVCTQCLRRLMRNRSKSQRGVLFSWLKKENKL